MMHGALEDITKAVGNTPIIRLQKVTAGLDAEIYVKCEYLNPGGSHKDRLAANLLRRAEYRAMLEGETARLAAGRATPSELRAIQAAAAGTRIAAERDDSPNFGPADLAFHVGVATAAHNPFLVTSVETVYRLLQHAVGLSVPRGVGSLAVAAGQHAAVCAAIEDGQLGPAEVAMRQHTETSAATFRHAVRHHFVSLIGGGPPANE